MASSRTVPRPSFGGFGLTLAHFASRPECLELAVRLAILGVRPGGRVLVPTGFAGLLFGIHINKITDSDNTCQGPFNLSRAVSGRVGTECRPSFTVGPALVFDHFTGGLLV